MFGRSRECINISQTHVTWMLKLGLRPRDSFSWNICKFSVLYLCSVFPFDFWALFLLFHLLFTFPYLLISYPTTIFFVPHTFLQNSLPLMLLLKLFAHLSVLISQLLILRCRRRPLRRLEGRAPRRRAGRARTRATTGTSMSTTTAPSRTAPPPPPLPATAP